jgi:hypothetical protein
LEIFDFALGKSATAQNKNSNCLACFSLQNQCFSKELQQIDEQVSIETECNYSETPDFIDSDTLNKYQK